MVLTKSTIKGAVGPLQTLLGAFIRLTPLRSTIITLLVTLTVLLRLRAMKIAAIRILPRK